jgi:hypothetical protein
MKREGNELPRIPIPRASVYKPRITYSRQLAAPRKSVLRSAGSAARESAQTSGGVLSQAMPLSVILKTVAPTRVALGLGSM